MRHSATPTVKGALCGLAVVASFAMFFTVVLLVFGPFGIHKSTAPPATAKPIAKMSNEALLESAGEPAGTIDCSVALQAAGVQAPAGLTGLVWDQAEQGRVLIVCAP